MSPKTSRARAGNSSKRVQMEPQFYPEPVGSQPLKDTSKEEAIYVTPSPLKYDVTSCVSGRLRRAPAWSFERAKGRGGLAWYTDKGLDVTPALAAVPGPNVHYYQYSDIGIRWYPIITGRPQTRAAQGTPGPQLVPSENWDCRKGVTLKGRLAKDVSADLGLQQPPVQD